MYISTLSWPRHQLEVSGQLNTPAALPPGDIAPGIHWIGGWVDPRAGLEDVGKKKFLTLPGLELRTLGRPARSQSLYRLRYPASRMFQFESIIKVSQCVILSFTHLSLFLPPTPKFSSLFPNASVVHWKWETRFRNQTIVRRCYNFILWSFK
jgi:hypothetical protein